jgi:hypothetical protein
MRIRIYLIASTQHRHPSARSELSSLPHSTERVSLGGAVLGRAYVDGELADGPPIHDGLEGALQSLRGEGEPHCQVDPQPILLDECGEVAQVARARWEPNPKQKTVPSEEIEAEVPGEGRSSRVRSGRREDSPEEMGLQPVVPEPPKHEVLPICLQDSADLALLAPEGVDLMLVGGELVARVV